MDSEIVSQLKLILPSVFTFIGVVVVLTILNFQMRRELAGELSVSRQLLMLCLTATGLLIFIFSLPLSEASQGQILSLLGIVVTAVIALSSTTFVANFMAGLMLRAVNSFKPGDFVRSDTFFGRVTERGIFHTEIQTEDRDLTTLPNLYLVTNPVTVVLNSGTIISATLSLGYDIPHTRIEELLKQAAEETELEDPFVLVVDLNDFSVSYRVGGFSADTSYLLTIKSNLRKNILTRLHENGIEIVSPGFMNQRVLTAGEKIIPEDYREKPAAKDEKSPEERIFDKAGTAAEHEQLKEELEAAVKRLAVLKDEIKSLKDEDATALVQERDQLSARVEVLSELVKSPSTED